MVDDQDTPTDEEAEAARDLRMATFRLSRRLRAERAIDTMSDAQFAVLATLRGHGPHTLGELAERERVTAPSMNRTVNCLEEAGWVTRTPDEVDRRKVNIGITDSGRELVTETVRRRDLWLANVVARLTPAERRTLAKAAVIMSEVATR
jgi:DNA-binding MarR family transcriptional regulator